MGLFDTVKRKFQSLRIHQPTRSEVILESNSLGDLGSLILEFEGLCLRRKILNDDQAELIHRLDEGSITAILFRKEMESFTEEATLVASRIEFVKSRLADLGYREIFV